MDCPAHPAAPLPLRVSSSKNAKGGLPFLLQRESSSGGSDPSSPVSPAPAGMILHHPFLKHLSFTRLSAVHVQFHFLPRFAICRPGSFIPIAKVRRQNRMKKTRVCESAQTVTVRAKSWRLSQSPPTVAVLSQLFISSQLLSLDVTQNVF